MSKCLQDAMQADRLFCLSLAIQLRSQPRALIVGQPLRLMRPVRQIEDRDQAEDDRRHSFDNE